MAIEGYRFYGDPSAACMFIHMTGDEDEEHMEHELKFLRKLSGRRDWCITAVSVEDWNQDLAPWAAEPVFGDEGFGDGAEDTLKELTAVILPQIQSAYPCPERKFVIAGYSLAGLFALYAAYRTDVFCAAAAASPSVWFPNWTAYAAAHEMQAGSVYLSLGLKEEKTRNPVMSKVGDAIREQHRILTEEGVQTLLEWNPGNHFIESDLRMAKGMHWVMNILTGLNQS